MFYFETGKCRVSNDKYHLRVPHYITVIMTDSIFKACLTKKKDGLRAANPTPFDQLLCIQHWFHVTTWNTDKLPTRIEADSLSRGSWNGETGECQAEWEAKSIKNWLKCFFVVVVSFFFLVWWMKASIPALKHTHDVSAPNLLEFRTGKGFHGIHLRAGIAELFPWRSATCCSGAFARLSRD